MNDRHGFVLVTVLLILVVVTVLALGAAFTSMVDRSITNNQRGATDAYYVAAAGLNKYKTVVFQTYRFYLDHPDEYAEAIRSGNPACGNYLNIGLDLNRNFVLGDSDDLHDGETLYGIEEANGTYDITFDVAGRYAILTAVGHVGNSRATVQIVAEPRNAGILNQALFAGQGQSSKFLNGNVEVYGGIHIEGDPSNSDTYVIDANGSFQQYNYYSLRDLEDVVTDSQITGAELGNFLSLNTHEQEDLCAHLRVEHGKIRLSGSASVGGDRPSRPAPTGFKTNLEGIEVDGGIEAMDSGTQSRMEADQITDFNLSDGPKFPGLDDTDLELTDECAGSTTWRDCLHASEELYVFTEAGPGPAEEPCSGDFASLIDGDALVFGTNEISCVTHDVAGNVVAGFEYEYVGDDEYRLIVHGITNFRGLDLVFSKDLEIRFDEQATFFVESNDEDAGGDVSIEGHLLAKESFPDTAVLGMIVENTLSMSGQMQKADGTPKQQVAMGMFYAGESAEIVKGAAVFGTVMAPTFTFSSGGAGQTSKLVQVPGLSYSSAPGFNFIQDTSEPTFRVASFERR